MFARIFQSVVLKYLLKVLVSLKVYLNKSIYSFFSNNLKFYREGEREGRGKEGRGREESRDVGGRGEEK